MPGCKSYPVMTQQQRGGRSWRRAAPRSASTTRSWCRGCCRPTGYARLRILSAEVAAAESADPSGDDPETEVKARLGRQSLLDRADGPRYTAVLEEAALGRRACPPEVLREQLAHLCELAMLPNVTLHVLLRDTRIGEFVPAADRLLALPVRRFARSGDVGDRRRLHRRHVDRGNPR